MKTIAIMNNKGGVGKTVTAINLADILVRDYRKRVLLVDCDGQMNLTRFFLPEFDPEINLSLADVLEGSCEPVWAENVMPIQPSLDLLPGSSGLYDLDFKALDEGGLGGCRLGAFLDAVAENGDVDYVICDCPPGYTLSSVNALLAADEVVVPMLLDGFSFTGMLDLQGQLRSLRSTSGRDKLAGVLLTQWHNSDVVRQGEEFVRQRDRLGVPVFRTVIRRTDKVPESTFDRQPIVRYSPRSAAALDYRDWVREYIGPVPELDTEVQ